MNHSDAEEQRDVGISSCMFQNIITMPLIAIEGKPYIENIGITFWTLIRFWMCRMKYLKEKLVLEKGV